MTDHGNGLMGVAAHVGRSIARGIIPGHRGMLGGGVAADLAIIIGIMRIFAAGAART